MESQEDFRVLFRLAKILHRADRSLPDLQKHAKAGEVMCIPLGLHARGFVELFLNFDLPRLYLFSRGSGPMPQERRELIRRIRQNSDRSAVILRQRALTNYPHPAAMHEEFRAPVAVNDDTDVPTVVVQHVLEHLKFPAWDQLDPQLRPRPSDALRGLQRIVLRPLPGGLRNRGQRVLPSLHRHLLSVRRHRGPRRLRCNRPVPSCLPTPTSELIPSEKTHDPDPEPSRPATA